MTSARPPVAPRRGARAPAEPHRAEFALASPIARLAGQVGRDAERISRASNPPAEALHRFHQRLRRLRTGLRIVRRALRPADRPPVAGASQRFGRLSRLVGEVRDLDVALDLLPAGPSVGPSRGRRAIELARRRMHEEAHTGRALLGAYLRAEIERELFDVPRRSIARAGRRLSGPAAARTFGKLLERSMAETERARRRAGRRPDAVRFHEFRVELRRTHYLVDLGGAAVGRPTSRFPGRLGDLQRSLGTMHDLDRLAELVETVGGGAVGGAWAASTERRCRRMRRTLADEVRTRAVRTAIRDLAA